MIVDFTHDGYCAISEPSTGGRGMGCFGPSRVPERLGLCLCRAPNGIAGGGKCTCFGSYIPWPGGVYVSGVRAVPKFRAYAPPEDLRIPARCRDQG